MMEASDLSTKLIALSSMSENNPLRILKNIPDIIKRRLDKISSCKRSFEAEVDTYQETLDSAGYDHNLS